MTHKPAKCHNFYSKFLAVAEKKIIILGTTFSVPNMQFLFNIFVLKQTKRLWFQMSLWF